MIATLNGNTIGFTNHRNYLSSETDYNIPNFIIFWLSYNWQKLLRKSQRVKPLCVTDLLFSLIWTQSLPTIAIIKMIITIILIITISVKERKNKLFLRSIFRVLLIWVGLTYVLVCFYRKLILNRLLPDT